MKRMWIKQMFGAVFLAAALLGNRNVALAEAAEISAETVEIGIVKTGAAAEEKDAEKGNMPKKIREWVSEKDFSGEYTYVVNEDETVTITAVNLMPNTDAAGMVSYSFPSQLSGRTVTGISVSGDGGGVGLVPCPNVVLPDTITQVEGLGKLNSSGELTYQVPENSAFEVRNNMLYEKETNILAGYAEQEDQEPVLEIPEGTKGIAAGALRGCRNVTEVVIPSSVTFIGAQAMPGSSSLVRVAVNAENPVYESRDGVLIEKTTGTLKCYPGGKTETVYELPADIQAVEEKAFDDNKNLTAIGAAEGNTAFASEDGVLFNADKTVLFRYPAGKADRAEYTVPEGVTEIASGAFGLCHEVKDIVLPEGMNRIGRNAFQWSGVEKINLPDTIEEIGEAAFRGSGLQMVKIPEAVISLPENMFEGCFALKEVLLPDTLQNIGYAAFGNTHALQIIGLPENLSRIGEQAFRSSGLTTVTLPSGCGVERQAFLGCTSLTKVLAAEANPQAGAGFIGEAAFSSCFELVSAEVPEGTVNIEAGAFLGAFGLKSAVLPSTVETIGGSAFLGCSDLVLTVKNDGARDYAEANGLEYTYEGNDDAEDENDDAEGTVSPSAAEDSSGTDQEENVSGAETVVFFADDFLMLSKAMGIDLYSSWEMRDGKQVLVISGEQTSDILIDLDENGMLRSVSTGYSVGGSTLSDTYADSSKWGKSCGAVFTYFYYMDCGLNLDTLQSRFQDFETQYGTFGASLQQAAQTVAASLTDGENSTETIEFEFVTVELAGELTGTGAKMNVRFLPR